MPISLGLIGSLTDKEILDRIFTLLDKIGSGEVDIREFLSSLAVFIIGHKADKISFGCQLFDTFDNKKLKSPQVVAMLMSMNTVCDVFGDVALEEKNIKIIVADVFEQKGVDFAGSLTLTYEDDASAISSHDLMEHFLPHPDDPVDGE
jgi:Ca2+-binding EF-hand superfamily protein